MKKHLCNRYPASDCSSCFDAVVVSGLALSWLAIKEEGKPHRFEAKPLVSFLLEHIATTLCPRQCPKMSSFSNKASSTERETTPEPSSVRPTAETYVIQSLVPTCLVSVAQPRRSCGSGSTSRRRRSDFERMPTASREVTHGSLGQPWTKLAMIHLASLRLAWSPGYARLVHIFGDSRTAWQLPTVSPSPMRAPTAPSGIALNASPPSFNFQFGGYDWLTPGQPTIVRLICHNTCEC